MLKVSIANALFLLLGVGTIRTKRGMKTVFLRLIRLNVIADSGHQPLAE